MKKSERDGVIISTCVMGGAVAGAVPGALAGDVGLMVVGAGVGAFAGGAIAEAITGRDESETEAKES